MLSAGIAVKSVGTGKKNAKSVKGICTVEEQAKVKAAILAMVAPTNSATSVTWHRKPRKNPNAHQA